MRQGAILLFSFLMAAIVGCGGGAGSSNNFAGTSTNPSLSTGSSPVTGGTPAPGTTTAGSTTPPPSSSGSGSSDSGTPSSGSASSNPPTTTASSSGAEVTIDSPVEGAAVSSPAQVAASASGSAAISSMQLYVDDAVGFQAASSQVNAALPLPNGAHTIVAQAWDQNGNSYKSAPVHIVVQGGAAPAPPAPAPPAPAPPAPAPPAPAPPPPPSAPGANVSQIQTQGGWADCDICAGAAGNGPGTPHGMQEGVNSPSLSGSAARFDLGGTAWGAALWWRELGGHDDAQNLRYDLDFYVDSVSNGQALEFDVNQTVGGSRYIFGTECDFRGSGTWRVWNAPGATWASTGVPCPVPDTNTWHHLTWEFQRGGGQTHFIAVTLDGNRHDVGMSFGTKGEAGSGLDVAFQADLTGSGGSESIWLDNVNLSW
jgi:hypothetical protein